MPMAQVSEFEDNVVWRAADLLGVSSRDRIDLKHRVAGGNRAGHRQLGCRGRGDLTRCSVFRPDGRNFRT